MTWIAGLDVGSLLAKAVIMEDGGILASCVRPIGGNFRQAAHDVLAAALDMCGCNQDTLSVVGTTGLGAAFVPGPSVRSTEIACQARGIHYLLPHAKNVIEIGDRSARVIKLTEGGKVADCVSNEKCATGNGRVLQIIAKVLGLGLTEMGNLSLRSVNPVGLSTGCSVFTETEAVSRIAEGARVEDIVAGLHQAMAVKIGSMMEKVKMEGDAAITGGGACDPGLVKMLEKVTGKKLAVSHEPLLSGAIGAALMAMESRGVIGTTGRREAAQSCT